MRKVNFINIDNLNVKAFHLKNDFCNVFGEAIYIQEIYFLQWNTSFLLKKKINTFRYLQRIHIFWK